MRAAGRLNTSDEYLFDPPDLWPGWAWILEGYDEVSTDRQMGMGGAGPVPFMSVRAWLADEGLTGSEAELFRAVVRKLDAVYFEHQAELAEKRPATGVRRG